MSKKFLLIYRSDATAEQGPPPSAEEMQAVLAQWMQWKESFPAILDVGDGLLPTGKRFKAGTVTDGPHIESKEIVSGYSIVGAASYDEALKVAKACPINHMPGNSIEIRELAGY
jgi:hypothetical protein